MAEQDNAKHLEQMLDSLLSSYSDAQPRPGLETRVLASVRAEAEKQKSPGWRYLWMWAGAAAAVLMVAAMVVMSQRERTVPPQPTTAQKPQLSIMPPEKLSADHQKVGYATPRRQYSQSPRRQPEAVTVSEVR